MTAQDLFAKPEPPRRGTRLPADWKPTLEAAKTDEGKTGAYGRPSGSYAGEVRVATEAPAGKQEAVAALKPVTALRDSYTTGKHNKSSISLLSSPACCSSVLAGCWGLQGLAPAGYKPVVGGSGVGNAQRPVVLDRVPTSDTNTASRVVESGRHSQNKDR